MTTLLTTELIERAHQGSKAKGFWDETPPQGQQLMLVISELAEALEAHRKGKVCTIGASSSVFQADMHPDLFPAEFLTYVKDTVGDEMADAYIRLCDFIGGFAIEVPNEEDMSYAAADTTPMPRNFGESLIEITGGVSDAWQELRYGKMKADVGMYLAASCLAIEKLCKQQDIPLAEHINAKLRYNATRNRLHGKSY